MRTPAHTSTPTASQLLQGSSFSCCSVQVLVKAQGHTAQPRPITWLTEHLHTNIDGLVIHTTSYIPHEPRDPVPDTPRQQNLDVCAAHSRPQLQPRTLLAARRPHARNTGPAACAG